MRQSYSPRPMYRVSCSSWCLNFVLTVFSKKHQQGKNLDLHKLEPQATITTESVVHQLILLEQHVLVQPLLDQTCDGVGVTDPQVDAGAFEPHFG